MPLAVFEKKSNTNISMEVSPTIFLIDNGSLRAEAHLGLRCLADQLSRLVKRQVLPVSLLHSNKMPAIKLFGRKACTVKSTLHKWVKAGERAFIFLPLFLGPSRAITDYLPKLIDEERAKTPDLNVVIAPPLAGEFVEDPDIRLAEILASNVRKTFYRKRLRSVRVAVIDHGTPVKAVNQVRNCVAKQVGELLGRDVAKVTACSMERREGEAYAFNEPLLENLGKLDDWHGSDLIVAMFFILPGRHAGRGGDVAEICETLMQHSVFRSIQPTALMGKHPKLIEILVDRLHSALGTFTNLE